MEDIQDKPAAVLVQDELSQFFDSISFDLRSFGKWVERDISILENYTISDYEFIYIVKGCSKMTKNGVSYTATKGQIMLLEPFQIYTSQP